MDKDVTSSNADSTSEKKPFYKKWWFIALVVIVVLAVIGSEYNESVPSSSPGSTSSVSTSSGQDEQSVEAQADVEEIERLERPTIERIESGQKSILIDWNFIEHSKEYGVFRSTSEDDSYEKIATTDESWYRDYDINAGTRYYYKVRAYPDDDSYKNSKFSPWRSSKIKVLKNSKGSSTNTGNTTNDTKVASDPVVYITNTGSKYHNAGCRYLRQSSIEIYLSQAQNAGYTACSVCF